MRTWIVPAAFFAAMYLLVFFRGVVGSDTPVDQMPLNLANKAISLAAVGTLAVALIVGPWIRRKPHITPEHPLHPRPLGWGVLTLSIAHAVMSVLMMNPAYMDKFYHTTDTGMVSMHLLGELSMLASVVALLVLIWQGLISRRIEFSDGLPTPLLRNLGLIVMILAGLHLVFMGYDGWFDPASPGTLFLQHDRWRWGMLPPSTFMGITLVTAGIVGNLISRLIARFGGPGRQGVATG